MASTKGTLPSIPCGPRQLYLRKKAVWTAVEYTRGQTATAIGMRLGITEVTAGRYLRELEREGLVYCEPIKGTVGWMWQRKEQ